MECRLRQRRCCTPLQSSRDVCHVFPHLIALLFCHLKRDFWRCPAVCRWWVEARVIWRSRLHGLLHGVVDVEDDALRAVCAVGLLVLAFDDGEGLQYVVHIGTPEAVEVTGSRMSLRWKGASCNTPERVILNPIYAA